VTQGDLRGMVEVAVMRLWEELLGACPAPEEDFFAAGGDSIALLTLATELEDQFGVPFALVDFVACPTPAFLTGLVLRSKLERSSLTSAPSSELLRPLSQATRPFPPIFLVHSAAGEHTYLSPTLNDLPLYSYRALGVLPTETPLASMGDMARLYVEKLVIKSPDGPYFLAGYSAGATIAHAMAALLEKTPRGGPLALISIDGAGPTRPSYTARPQELLQTRLVSLVKKCVGDDAALRLQEGYTEHAALQHLTAVHESRLRRLPDAWGQTLDELYRLQSVYAHVASACAAYEWAPIVSKVVLLMATRSNPDEARLRACWSQTTSGGCELIHLNETHETIRVSATAAQALRDVVAAACAERTISGQLSG